ncbi:IS1182 family transposase [Rubrivirga sp.]|uniref:IS1182 family transposase n=1 Tax=Rubrivirga sp. TaxID=1885344 RepID=UPI003C706E90
MLQPQTPGPVPRDTARVARAAFPKGSPLVTLRDELGTVFSDDDFAALYPSLGQPAYPPWRLALVTVLQFRENLTDRQAADAVRARLDWKYALSLELDDPGFDFSVLSEFRARLLDGGAEDRLLGRMLELFQGRGLLAGGGRQRTDATHVVGAVRELNRLEIVGETLHAALNVLAQVAPAWLSDRVDAGWFERYGERFSDYRLPKPYAERVELVGCDGMGLLDAVYGPEAPDYLRAVPTVDVLRRVWVQHFYVDGDRLRWREQKSFPPSALMVASPYDLDVRYSQKRGTEWKGFKVHLTETCEPDRPNLITHVATTAATDQDVTALEGIHDGLGARGLLPAEHLADGAYLSAAELVKSRDRYGVEMVGPMRVDASWQAADPDALEAAQFAIDWEAEQVTCPMGERSYKWSPSRGRGGKPSFHVQFPKRACAACEARPRCTRSETAPRSLGLHPRAEHEAMVAAREHQKTAAFKERYKARSGVEGTISEAAFALGMRRARYRGREKTHLQHVATAAAMNLKRALAWLDGVPRSGTRVSHFARLAVAA